MKLAFSLVHQQVFIMSLPVILLLNMMADLFTETSKRALPVVRKTTLVLPHIELDFIKIQKFNVNPFYLLVQLEHLSPHLLPQQMVHHHHQ